MTLIEVLVATVLSSLVMGVVISFAVALMRSDRKVRAFAIRIERRSELAAALRSDLRHAAEASLQSSTIVAIKLQGDRDILYELDRSGCRRVVSAAGQRPAQREFFAVGAAEAWNLYEAAPGRRPLIKVSMQFAERDKEKDSRPAPLLVYAALGADLPDAMAPVLQPNATQTEQETEEFEQEETEKTEKEDN
jgi:hypothetical protein